MAGPPGPGFGANPCGGPCICCCNGADYAEQYLNTDDPVLSTNKPLQKCATVDVTSLRPPEIFGHDWPLVYYTQTLKGNGIVAHEERRTIGSVEML